MFFQGGAVPWSWNVRKALRRWMGAEVIQQLTQIRHVFLHVRSLSRSDLARIHHPEVPAAMQKHRWQHADIYSCSLLHRSQAMSGNVCLICWWVSGCFSPGPWRQSQARGAELAAGIDSALKLAIVRSALESAFRQDLKRRSLTNWRLLQFLCADIFCFSIETSWFRTVKLWAMLYLR